MVMRAEDVLKLVRQKGSEVKIISEQTLCLSYQQMLLNPEKELAKEDELVLKNRISRLESGEPLQYILGKWEFEGREFFVGEGVLIPREDTSALTALSREILNGKKDAVFSDLGSGSGCIAISLNLDCGAKGYAVERSKKAFMYLKKNIESLGADVTAILGDMFDGEIIKGLEPLDLAVSNPPYITAQEMLELDKTVLREPREALFGGEDGLDYYRKIAEVYKPRLKEGGALAFEVGYLQADAVAKILKDAGYKNLREKKDINEIRRAVCAFK